MPNLVECKSESCFNVEFDPQRFSNDDELKLLWLLRETFEPENTTEEKTFLPSSDSEAIVEVGPRLTFSTAWSSNCMSMCCACGIVGIGRIEMSRRYQFRLSSPITAQDIELFASLVHDRMTECVYPTPLIRFASDEKPESVYTIPLIAKGQAALQEINRTHGLGFDAADLQYYADLFVNTLKRDPTNVECFDLSQSNSEHSRHWFFGGQLVVDGEERRETLFEMVKSTLPASSNSVIAFHDNSSVSYKCAK